MSETVLGGGVTPNLWETGLQRMVERIVVTAEEPSDWFPHFADPKTGEWVRTANGDWTGGFWNAELWALAAINGGEVHLDPLPWARRIRSRVRSETVFRGFLFWYGAALGAVLCGSTEAAEIAEAGALGLADLYNRNAGLIPLGREAEEAADVGLGAANIDGVPGTVPLLVWAATRTDRPDLFELAETHAARHRDWLVRADGSVIQSARFDPDTGSLLGTFTHKGLRNDSVWTRAQAWGMLGFAHAATWLGADFLPAARATADWWIDHVPPDRVSWWDFEAVGGKRDTSGTAIAAAAMLKLSALSESSDRDRYLAEAERSVGALLTGYLTPIGSGNHPPGILTQGCYNHRIGLATANELIWGDYFLLESLLVLNGRIDPLAV